MTTSLAIELGTSYTTIFVSGNGIVLREPSVVAYSGRYIRAVGQRAKEMLGRAPERTLVTCPIKDGIVDDAEAAVMMLSEFLSKVLPQKGLFRRVRAILAIPCGLTAEEKGVFETVLIECGVRHFTLVESVICAAHGLGLNFRSAEGCLVADIGGGTTDIAVISLAGIVEGCSISIGSAHLDTAVQRYVQEKHNLTVGALTAQKIKETIGSLYDNDASTMLVSGTDSAKNPSSAIVESAGLIRALLPFYNRIAEAIEAVINLCAPELVGYISKSGVNLCGGGSLIGGLSEYLQKRLYLPIVTSPDALYAVSMGAGLLLNDEETLSEIMQQN